MRIWRFLRLPHFPSPVALATGLVVALTGLAFVASSPQATAETASAAVALGPDEVVVAGTVIGTSETMIGIQEADGAAPVAFPVAQNATLSRNGQAVALVELRQNDTVRLTVDGTTGVVRQLTADPSGVPFRPSNELAFVATLGLVAGAMALVARHRSQATGSPAETAGQPSPAQRGRQLALARLPVQPYARRRQSEYPV